MSPYLLIKVSWVVGSLLGLAPIGQGFNLTEWFLLNTVTIGMAGIGIALSLALVQPWGMRIPGRLVAFCAWTGAGFLVSILPYAVLSAVLDAGHGGAPNSGGDDAAMPGWEGALIQFSFVGMGLGLALALPAYPRRRWPEAFTARVGDDSGRAAPWAAAVAAVVGLVWAYWAVGGSLGVAHPAQRDTNGYLLTGVGALWALAGSAAVWMLAQQDPTRGPHRRLLMLGWLGSGSLFAWSSWKLPITLFVALAHPHDVPLPEDPAVAAVLHLAAVVAGVGMLRSLVGSRPRTPAGTSPTSLHASGPGRY
ncbi:membrane protein [Streptomyces noursei ATCC 11455]|nr:membrane protein [Streptomyces noursei ATCC 11455]